MKELYGIEFRNELGLYNEELHGHIADTFIDALYRLREQLHDYRGKATLRAFLRPYKGTRVTSIQIRSDKPKLRYEVWFLGEELRRVGGEIDKRLQGKNTDIIPRIIKATMVGKDGTPPSHKRVTFEGGGKAGFYVWLRYGFLPLPSEEHKFEFLREAGWDGRPESLQAVVSTKEGKRLIFHHKVNFEGYIELSNVGQVTKILQYIDSRLRD